MAVAETYPIEAEAVSPASPVSAAAPVAGGVSVVNVVKTFGPTRALGGVTFNARMGEIHAIVGGNGCGKSTLAKVMSGVLPIDSGQVSIMGHTPSSPADAKAHGIATVFQEVLVADTCSVVDNLFVGADGLFSRALAATEKSRRAAQIMEDLTGEPVHPETLAGDLPLSLKQWITIARALLVRPKVLILDESSAALDFDSTERLFTKMRELRDAGAAVLIVTHRIAELIRISDRATVLRDGKDVGVLDKHEITEKNLLELMTNKPQAQLATTGGGSSVAVEGGHWVMRTRALKVTEAAAPVDLTVRPGEIIGLAGLDGQGHSEFIQALAGIHRPVEGVAEIAGGDHGTIALKDLETARANKVIYVSGDRKKEGILPNLSIFENMMMPLYRVTSRVGKLAVIDWAGLSGTFEWEREKLSIRMGERFDKITSLSGGNQQKVLIGRAFALNPSILLLNDPARGIDVGAKTELYRHLRSFAASGRPVIYLSSEIEEFVGFASRVLVFRNGSVFDSFDESNIDPDRILAAMFGQTGGLRTTTPHQANATADKMKIVEFDPDRDRGITREDLGEIKIREFGTAHVTHREGEASPPSVRHPSAQRDPIPPRPHEMKIIDFDQEAQETQILQAIGPIKVVDMEKEEERERQRARAASPVSDIKIVEFD